MDQHLLDVDIQASIAHARMLGAQGIIPREDAGRIVKGLQQILDDDEFELDPRLEDVHMNVESELTKRIGPVAGRLHTARSRNDQVATDFRLYVLGSTRTLLLSLVRLQAALIELAERNIDVVMPGYTHLQRAQPVLFAHHMLAYVEMFQRDFQRFMNAADFTAEMPLGSGALAGVPYDINREAVREELGFERISANSIDAVSDRDFACDYLYASAMTMVHISRLAEEIILWSTAEFGFIKLPDAFATGSSIMPQKKNPDVAELARGRSARTIGNLTTMLALLKGLPLAYNRDLQEDKQPLMDTEAVLVPTLWVFAVMLPNLVVDGERARKAAAENYALATDLADYLVRKGLPFREAHEIVGKLVRHAEDKRAELHDLTMDEYRAFSPLFGDDVLAIDVIWSINSRDVPGGTAPPRVRAALAKEKARVEEMLAEAGEDFAAGLRG